jgi:4-coumarate--CoA ligase
LIINDDGKDISGFDTVGEFCLRGPIMTNGYLENAEANAESADSDVFFGTRDISFCDGKSKKGYIIDRRKELIKVRAFQVAPPEIEGVLLSHPHIVDAEVIVVKHPVELEARPQELTWRKDLCPRAIRWTRERSKHGVGRDCQSTRTDR